jgi:hypothetical protein
VKRFYCADPPTLTFGIESDNFVSTRGPSPDFVHARKLLDRALDATTIKAVALDAGYDAEHVHRFA